MTVQTTSDKFVELVRRSVAFGDSVPDDVDLRDRIVKMIVLGAEDEALGLIRSGCSLSDQEARELVNRIGIAADEAFYLTGLRP